MEVYIHSIGVSFRGRLQHSPCGRIPNLTPFLNVDILQSSSEIRGRLQANTEARRINHLRASLDRGLISSGPVYSPPSVS